MQTYLSLIEHLKCYVLFNIRIDSIPDSYTS